MIAIIMLAALCGLLVVGMAKGGGLILLFATSSLIFVVLFTILRGVWVVWFE